MEKIRTFIAVELSGETKKELRGVIDALKKTNDNIKWVNPDNIHLTLKFLGNVRFEDLPGINEKLKFVTAGLRPFHIRIVSIGSFPNWKDLKVIWAGIEDDRRILETISVKIEKAMGELGFDKEKRHFKAHLTLGRVKDIKDKEKFIRTAASIPIKPTETYISEFVIFKSILTPRGAVYSRLSSVSLV